MKRVWTGILVGLLVLTMSIVSGAADLPQIESDTIDSSIHINVTDITPRGEIADKTQTDTDVSYSIGGYYPVEIQAAEENDTRLLYKTFVVPQTTAPESLIEERLIRGGVEYRVLDILRQETEGVRESKTVFESVTVPSASDDETEILSLFSADLPYNKNGFSGTLTLDAASITIEVADTERYSYPITDVREYKDLIRNDPVYVQKTVEKDGVMLQLAGIEWVPMATPDENSTVPSRYKAVATYSGTGWENRATGYLATAVYTGEVASYTPGEAVVSIVYEACSVKPLDVHTTDEEASMNSEKVNQSDPFDWTPVIIFVLLAGGIAGAMICVRWWLQRKSKNGGLFQARVMKHVPYDEQPNRKMPEILNEMDRGLEE